MAVRKIIEQIPPSPNKKFNNEWFWYVATYNNKGYAQLKGHKMKLYSGMKYRVVKIRNGMYRLYAECH